MTTQNQPPSFWLMKSEPDVYSIEDLRRDSWSPWEGVRNYQARNFMRDKMRVGDYALFYHSNAKPPGVAGLARVCKEAYPDFTAWDPDSKYFDAKTDKTDPRWMMVDVAFEARFETLVSLSTLKADPELAEMLVVQKGQRLSVQPVEPAHFERVLALANCPWPRNPSC